MIRLGNGTPVGPYRIQRFIKDSLLNSCYVVDDGKDGRFFLKLFDPQAIPAEWLEGGEVREIVISRGLDNGQVTSYVADGTLTVDGVAYPYLVMQFYHGILLSEILKNRQFTAGEVRNIACFVLQGLAYLRGRGLNHNDITPRNILLEASSNSLQPKIIDLGHACREIRDGNPPFPLEDLNLLYTAPEALDGIFTDASDAFSVAALLFKLICGREPVWPAALHATDRVLQNIVLKGLQLNPVNRLSTAQMLEMLTGQSGASTHAAAQAPRPEQKSDPSGLKATTDGTPAWTRSRRCSPNV